MRIAQHISELIGNTPLVQLNSVVPPGSGRVVAKVEYLNPGRSSKDRIAVKMIDAAEASGELKPGGTIVEPTSGNTGVGLALVAQQPRLPVRVRLPGQGQRGQAECAARLRRRGGGVPDGGAARTPRQLLQRLRPAGRARSTAPGSPTSTPTRRARPATTRPPARRSGPTPTARSPTSSPASAPAGRSPARAATSRRCPAGG